jgi:cytochrome c oxidase assembly factor CtaG
MDHQQSITALPISNKEKLTQNWNKSGYNVYSTMIGISALRKRRRSCCVNLGFTILMNMMMMTLFPVNCPLHPYMYLDYVQDSDLTNQNPSSNNRIAGLSL